MHTFRALFHSVTAIRKSKKKIVAIFRNLKREDLNRFTEKSVYKFLDHLTPLFQLQNLHRLQRHEQRM